MTTARLDALLTALGVATTNLFTGFLSPAEWDRWRLNLELAGGDWVAIPFGTMLVPVGATLLPIGTIPAGVRSVPSAMVANILRRSMMLALQHGWAGRPDFSERLATKLDAAEKAVRDFGPTPWTWPALPA